LNILSSARPTLAPFSVQRERNSCEATGFGDSAESWRWKTVTNWLPIP
jgi:hypothetical protein